MVRFRDRCGVARVHRVDGSNLDGELTGWLAASKEFLFKT